MAIHNSIEARVLEVQFPDNNITWELLEMQMIRPHAKPSESETLGFGPGPSALLELDQGIDPEIMVREAKVQMPEEYSFS
ncbi:hypothetical protein PRBEI_2001795000 [Prionailurus iriomotensis]